MAVAARQRLTKTVVEGASLPPGARRRYLFDSEVPGFCLIVLAGKARVWRTYALRFTAQGKRRWLTIGEHGGPWTADPRTGKPRLLTAELAREQALKYRGAWQAGEDPRALRDAGRARGEPKPRPDCPTLETFSQVYLSRHSDVHKAYRSAKEDRITLKLYLLPWKGKVRLDAITAGHVADLQARLKDRPFAANRALTMIRHMFNLAIHWGVLPKDHGNPCAGTRMLHTEKRERYLTAEEMSRLGPALMTERAAHPFEVAAILVLAFSGARPAEILALQRAKLHLELGHVMIERKKRWRPLFLPAPAIAVLEGVPESDDPRVFPIQHYHLTYIWSKVRTVAGLKGVRLYDLRHTLASVATQQGRNLQLIGRLLGHSNTRTTERYAHLAENDVRAAGDSVAGQIAAALKVTE